MPSSREDGGESGFTLLEILVALVIFALAFGVLAQIMQTGLRQSALARSLSAASLLARSELARVGVEIPLAVGQAEGEAEGGMRWQTEIELVEGPSEHQSLALYQVQVTVAWGASPAERLMFTTLRAGASTAMSGRPLRSAEHGFTLLELLVAIMLLGLLMAVLFGGLRLGARVWEKADARLDASVRVQIAQDFIRQRLSEMLPLDGAPPERAELALSEPLFAGTVGAVRFATQLTENLGAGIFLAELAFVESRHASGAGKLVLRWRPLEPSTPTAEEIEERVLIDGIEALELSYFGTLDPEQPPDWWQAWEGQAKLPQLIRLRVRFADHDERRWPELIVRPMLDRAGI